MTEKIDYLLVGGGLTSATAADTLRRSDVDATIQIISAEIMAPYHRPRLSKQYLVGTSKVDDILVHPAAYYPEQNIDLRLGEQVSSVDARANTVTTSKGRTVGYGKLLIATGSSPRRLHAPNDNLKHIYYLRSRYDCDAIRAAAATGKTAVVLGASFLGMEIALSLIGMGLKVTLLDVGERILPHIESDEISTYFKTYAEGRGARILLQDTVQNFHGTGSVTGVRTQSGEDIACDMVVVSIGVDPATGFLACSGIALEDGYVAVDETLRTNIANIYAAGDVTKFYDPVFACRRHIEHWDNAVRQGRLAARNMMGERHRYDEVSYFYCDIGEIGFDMLGMPAGADTQIARGNLADNAYALYYLRDNVPRAAFSMGRPPGEVRLAESVIHHHVNLAKYQDQLRDPAFRLDSMPTQTVLVLQGGGALGAFECGVVKALQEDGIQPDIVAGISIGALNGAIVAGNPGNAAEALEAFWNDLTVATSPLLFPDMRRAMAAAQILTFGVPKFFKPRWMPPLDLSAPWTAYYDTAPMRQLIAKYVDFAALKKSPTRLLVAAVNVATAKLAVFDSYVDDITPDHVLASGSLPPGFAWTTVDGNAYWDGGIVSNSPLDLVWDRCGPDGKRAFIVDLYSGEAPLPKDLAEVLTRRDEIVYSERIRSDLQIRELRDAYREMVNMIVSDLEPAARARVKQHPRYIQLMGDGCATAITRFLRPRTPGESSNRDYDFSDIAIQHHRAEGYAIAKERLAAQRALAKVSAKPPHHS